MRHIQTAVGMFNAGEVLREYSRYQDIATEEEKGRRTSTTIPMVVVYILGIEVGIKALIEKQGQNPPRIHDLIELYGKLPDTIQKRVEDKVAANGVKLLRVKALLTKHRNSLEEWRYIGDFDKDLVIDLGAIAATLNAIIIVHTEEDGAEAGQRAQESKDRGGIPPHLEEAANDYNRDVFETDVTRSGKPPDSP